MSKIQSIDNIKEGIKLIKDSIKNIDVGQYDDQSFEGGYTYRELLDELNSLLVNLNALLKKPKKFLEVSTPDERNNINSYLGDLNTYLSDPSNLNNSISVLKTYIRPFYPYYTNNRLINLDATLDKYDEKLKAQDDKYKQYDKDIEKYSTEKDTAIENIHDEQKKLNEQAEKLIQQAKNSLSLTSSAGIGQFFQERLKITEKKKSWLWIFGAFIFIGSGIGLTILFIFKNPSTDFSTTFSRLSIIALPLAGAWFCAGQYTKAKNITEDYAYKTVLTQSIIGFSEQLKNDDEKDTSYQDYMKKMLDEIHQHPVPKHKREDIDKTSTEKIMQIVSELLKKEKSSGKNND